MHRQEEIMDKINDRYKFKIQSSIVNAVKHYQEKLSDESLFLSPLTKSSYIRDFILKNIIEAFKNEASVEIIRKKGMILLLIKTNPVIMLKFKKFNKYYRIAAARTIQAMAYSNQTQGELFPDYSSTIHLHAGYKWDESYTQVDCLIGLPNSLTGHSWVTLIPASGELNKVVETTKDEVVKKKNVKLKQRKGDINEQTG
jgi:hypothetical protein